MKAVLRMLPLLLAVTAFTSCANYGKKVKIEGTKGEVYYEGEGVTESDAKKLGEFLKKEKFYTNEKKASTQISKIGDRYIVRFVYDKAFYEKTPDVEKVFKAYTNEISKIVFGGSKVDITLADNTMKDFKSIPYDETMAQAESKKPAADNNNLVTTNTNNSNDLNTTTTSLEDYDSDEAGGVKFFWKDITDDESKTIADYIVKNGSFYTTQGNVNIIMEKQGDRYIIKFPVADSYLEDQTTLDLLKTVSQQIKDNVFANVAYSFIMTDTNLKNIRSWDY
jgi:hypothetical protein